MARWVPGVKVRRRCGEALSLFERNKMSGSEFERENIVAETLSATAASKPADTLADTPREHDWHPPAEGMYDLSMEKFLRRRLHRQHQGQESHIRSSPTRSAFSATSNIAARSAPIRAPATAPAFWCRSARVLRAQGRRDRLQAAGPGHYAIGALFMPRARGGR